MKLDRAGVPFIVGSLVPAVVSLLARRPRLAVAFGALAGFMVFFFRDPDRTTPAGDDLVVAPADGRVMVAGDPEPGAAPPGEWKQVSLFLSPMDVHVNRIPFGGRVTRVETRRGRFLPAYRTEAARENARTEIRIERDGTAIVVRQVVGVLARRIVCRATPGATVRTGDRYGLMKFGSRMDVFLPADARVLVHVGEHVRGGETVIAEIGKRLEVGGGREEVRGEGSR